MAEYLVPPDTQDAALGKRDNESIFQRARLLSPQQRILMDALLTGKSLPDAAVLAGYARRGGSAALRGLQRKVPDIMDRLKLTDTLLIKNHLIPLLNANETKFFKSSEDELLEAPARPALGIRRDALDMAFKLRGSYADRDDAADVDQEITVNILNIGAQA